MQIRTDKNARVHPATGPGTGTCVFDNVKALLLRDFTHSERAFEDYSSALVKATKISVAVTAAQIHRMIQTRPRY